MGSFSDQSPSGYRRLGRSLPGMVYQFFLKPDGSMGFSDLSLSAETLYEAPLEVLLNNPQVVFDLLDENESDDFHEKVLRSASELSPFRWTGKLVFPDGRVKWITAGSTPRRERDGTIIWDGMAIDITAQKESEEKLAQERMLAIRQSKLASLGQLAAGIAHEINNPLTVILGELEDILADTPREQENQRQCLERLLKMGTRISKIIRGLRMLSRSGDEDPFESVYLQEVVNDAICICERRVNQLGIRLEVEVDKQIQVECRQVQIVQCLTNLISNSMDAAHGMENPWIRISANQDPKKQTVKLSVKDSGSGISPAVRAELFTPFFTTKGPNQGTGLGLPICKSMIEAHHGELFYNSTSSNTEFVIELPLKQEEKNVA